MAFTGAEIDHRIAWEAGLATGGIENRNPPAPPEAVAIRAANDALFHTRRP